VNVVVDEEIAVLEVLPFTDAVGSDEEIYVAIGAELLGTFLGEW
jgi:hypothetical protein